MPEHRGKGVATALLEHVKGWTRETHLIAVLAYEGDKWFGYFPYMPARFFRRFGFTEVDRDGSRVLMLLDTRNQDEAAMAAASYSIMRPRTHSIPKGPAGKSVVEILVNSQPLLKRLSSGPEIARAVRAYLSSVR